MNNKFTFCIIKDILQYKEYLTAQSHFTVQSTIAILTITCSRNYTLKYKTHFAENKKKLQQIIPYTKNTYKGENANLKYINNFTVHIKHQKHTEQ